MNEEIKKVIGIHYTLTNDTGETIDSSIDSDPLYFLQKTGSVIKGLEDALKSKEIGDKFEVSISPEDAYGKYDENKIQEMPLSSFPKESEVKPGMMFNAEGSHGVVQVEVTKIENEMVTINGNHPLANQTLNFNVEVIELREATTEELDHGHVHGPGGHHH
ncbi:MAG: peptidylprolyl isomerase [Bacteroidetes bacterium]|nr:peptidylprolyl isomerase [Bacteroidia bacterium]MBN4052166.1 peptidylprolyl isomerase [Sphingobacteriaceae bacterium AH-315-L07]PCH67632.1 MAG: peptidylprolyl isomerase [Bacteroidota bacterium]